MEEDGEEEEEEEQEEEENEAVEEEDGASGHKEESEWTLLANSQSAIWGQGRGTLRSKAGHRSRPRLDLARLYDDGAAHRVLHRRAAGSLKTTTRPTLRKTTGRLTNRADIATSG